MCLYRRKVEKKVLPPKKLRLKCNYILNFYVTFRCSRDQLFFTVRDTNLNFFIRFRSIFPLFSFYMYYLNKVTWPLMIFMDWPFKASRSRHYESDEEVQKTLEIYKKNPKFVYRWCMLHMQSLEYFCEAFYIHYLLLKMTWRQLAQEWLYVLFNRLFCIISFGQIPCLFYCRY